MSRPTRGGLPVSTQQDQIVTSIGSRRVTVVSAGAGTGKTHTTIAAVLDLAENAGARLDQFILITFTRAAGDELRHRLESAVETRVRAANTSQERIFWEEQQERLTAAFVGTIHGFCREILRTYGYAEAIPHEADIRVRTGHLVQRAKEQALSQYLQWFEARSDDPRLLSSPLGLRHPELMRLVEEIWTQARSRGITAEQLHQATVGQATDEGRLFRTDLAWLVGTLDRRYREAKAEASILDSEDLLVRTRDLLASADGERVGRRVGQRYQYLFVDEFQDTDPTQKEIVDALTKHLTSVLVVGDEKQSIYGFRAAVVELLGQIAQENNVPILPLDESRRPTRRLLRAQTALFDSMAQRYEEFERPLRAPAASSSTCEEQFPPFLFLGRGGPRDLDQRTECTADQILSCLGQRICVHKGAEIISREAGPGDIVLLVRTNRIAAEYAEALRRRLEGRVDVRAEAGGGFYEQPEVVSTYHMLRLLLHYPDDTSLSLALLTPYLRTVDASVEEARLLQYGALRGHPLVDWFEATHPDLAEQVRELHNDVRVYTVPEILEAMYRAFEIREYYRSRGNEQAASNLEKLRELIRAQFRDDHVLTLRQFVLMLQRNLLSRYAEAQADVDEDEGATEDTRHVRIVTVHRSKGLQFPIVMIPEVQQALMPEWKMPAHVAGRAFGLDVNLRTTGGLRTESTDFASRAADVRQRQIEEEMRILYVAITRAQNQVILVGSNPRQPQQPANEWYSWQDEVVRARRPLELAGAQFA